MIIVNSNLYKATGYRKDNNININKLIIPYNTDAIIDDSEDISINLKSGDWKTAPSTKNEGNVYTNNELNISFEIPSGWSILDSWYRIHTIDLISHNEVDITINEGIAKLRVQDVKDDIIKSNGQVLNDGIEEVAGEKYYTVTYMREGISYVEYKDYYRDINNGEFLIILHTEKHHDTPLDINDYIKRLK